MSSNYPKGVEGGKGGFLSRPIYLIVLDFVLVIYLNEIMSIYDEFHYPRLEFFLDFPYDNSRVLRFRSDSKYNKDSFYKLLTKKSCLRSTNQ